MNFFFVTRSSASKTDICDSQILNRRQQLFKYNPLFLF